MKIKELLFSENSKKGKLFFQNMLRWLDNPQRKKYNNPEKLLRGSGIQPSQTVLEIGCGSGYFTIPTAKMLGQKGKLYAIDIHPLAVKETEHKVSESHLNNVVLQKADAMNSPFPDSMFDVVLLYGVIPAPVISMKDISQEVYRVLKPGGVCAIWTMVPFWSPRAVLKHARFASLKKIDGVFRMQKL